MKKSYGRDRRVEKNLAVVALAQLLLKCPFFGNNHNFLSLEELALVAGEG